MLAGGGRFGTCGLSYVPEWTAVEIAGAGTGACGEEAAARIAPWPVRWRRMTTRRSAAGVSAGVQTENFSGVLRASAGLPMRWKVRTMETCWRVRPPFSPSFTSVEALDSTTAAYRSASETSVVPAVRETVPVSCLPLTASAEIARLNLGARAEWEMALTA